jgi:hypothetical protein
MKLSLIAGAVCGSSLAVCAMQASAQDAMPRLVPVEIYMCDYVKGKDRADLQRVIDKWNKWADASAYPAYTAWVLTPNFFAPNYDFDVGWMGAWQDASGMGGGLQQWSFADGGMNAEFQKVVDCKQHGLMASMNLKMPEAWGGPTGAVSFSDCTIATGKTGDQVLAAHRGWADHLTAKGSKAGQWLFFPGPGAGDVSWDHKVVTGYGDYQSYGADFEGFTNGGGWREQAKLADTVACGSARLYTSELVRDGGVKPN